MFDMRFSLQGSRGNNAVIEHTETLSSIAEGVVRTTAKMHGKAGIKSRKTGFDGGSDRAPGAFDKFGGPGQADASDFLLN